MQRDASHRGTDTRTRRAPVCVVALIFKSCTSQSCHPICCVPDINICCSGFSGCSLLVAFLS